MRKISLVFFALAGTVGLSGALVRPDVDSVRKMREDRSKFASQFEFLRY